ncbi:MAG TPA: ester cyclase [Roseiflexaceae bacterium]|nr:ester cyclase [Roseiflexaceae bacterium]
MSTEQNIAIVRRIFDEVINQENKAALDDILAPDLVVNDPLNGRLQGAETFKGLLAFFDAAFPGHRVTVHRYIAEGDCVAVHHIHYARHAGDFMGLPPSGRELVVPGLELYRLSEGRIVEFWRHDDDAGMLRQLGLLPAPGQ